MKNSTYDEDKYSEEEGGFEDEDQDEDLKL